MASNFINWTRDNLRRRNCRLHTVSPHCLPLDKMAYRNLSQVKVRFVPNRTHRSQLGPTLPRFPVTMSISVRPACERYII